MKKSWSGIRKQLEQDFLCEKLRGRVQYFLTIYHGAPDDYGRFAVRVDGKEVFHANPYNETYFYEEVEHLQKQYGVSNREWTGKEFLFDKENAEIEEQAEQNVIEKGHIDSFSVTRAIDVFLNQSIEKSLESENLLHRMFAILDRRVGKRSLTKAAYTYESLPEWLKLFYELRFAVEGIK